MSVRVLIADDQALVRSGFRKLLESESEIEVVAEAADASASRPVRSSAVTKRLIERFALDRSSPVVNDRRLRDLTPRELEVTKLLAQGLSNSEIARELSLSNATVKTHVARILMKLELRDRVQIVVLAYESGLVNTAKL